MIVRVRREKRKTVGYYLAPEDSLEIYFQDHSDDSLSYGHVVFRFRVAHKTLQRITALKTNKMNM